jgi:hypothetical protein
MSEREKRSSYDHNFSVKKIKTLKTSHNWWGGGGCTANYLQIFAFCGGGLGT